MPALVAYIAIAVQSVGTVERDILSPLAEFGIRADMLKVAKDGVPRTSSDF